MSQEVHNAAAKSWFRYDLQSLVWQFDQTFVSQARSNGQIALIASSWIWVNFMQIQARWMALSMAYPTFTALNRRSPMDKTLPDLVCVYFKKDGENKQSTGTEVNSGSHLP